MSDYLKLPSILKGIDERDLGEFLIRAYFSDLQDPLIACLDHAYLDFCRTLPHVPKKIREIAMDKLRRAFSELTAEVADQEQFDSWHRETTETLQCTYSDGAYPNFYVGHAQKWINMTLKYAIVMGNALQGYERIFPFCHVPLDSIMIKAFGNDFPMLPNGWSKLNDYGKYLRVQYWIRQYTSLNYTDCYPIEVEFKLWKRT